MQQQQQQQQPEAPPFGGGFGLQGQSGQAPPAMAPGLPPDAGMTLGAGSQANRRKIKAKRPARN